MYNLYNQFVIVNNPFPGQQPELATEVVTRTSLTGGCRTPKPSKPSTIVVHLIQHSIGREVICVGGNSAFPCAEVSTDRVVFTHLGMSPRSCGIHSGPLSTTPTQHCCTMDV